MPVLLVFGARNLGRAIARYMSGRGWDVAAVARSEESLRRVEAEIPARSALSRTREKRRT